MRKKRPAWKRPASKRPVLPLLDKLTQEEEALIAKVRDEWLRIGMATDPADREAAQATISDAYREVGFEPPRLWIWLGSPKIGIIADCIVDPSRYRRAFEDLPEPERREVRDQIGDQIRVQLGGPVRDWGAAQIGRPIFHRIWPRWMEHFWHQVEREVANQVRSQMFEIEFQTTQVADQIEAHIWTQLWGHTWKPDPIRSRSPVLFWPKDELGAGAPFNGAGYSSYRVDDLAFADFFRRIERVSIQGPERDRPLMRAAAVAGWWWPFERACIVTERPTRLLRDAAHRLHCSDGPALLYPDGWAIYAWHAVPIHDWFVEDKRRITPDVIEAESNAELRRVLLEIFGFDRYIEVRGARLIAEDECLGLPRQLFELNVRGESVRVLRAVNGTVEADGRQRQFHLSVAFGCDTPHEAVAWTYGRPPHRYKEAVRT